MIRLVQHAYCLIHLMINVQVSTVKDAMSKFYPQLEVSYNKKKSLLFIFFPHELLILPTPSTIFLVIAFSPLLLYGQFQ